MLNPPDCWHLSDGQRKIMYHSISSWVVAPIVGWLAGVSVLLVAYLISLTLEERRRNRRMDQERHRLGLL